MSADLKIGRWAFYFSLMRQKNTEENFWVDIVYEQDKKRFGFQSTHYSDIIHYYPEEDQPIILSAYKQYLSKKLLDK